MWKYFSNKFKSVFSQGWLNSYYSMVTYLQRNAITEAEAKYISYLFWQRRATLLFLTWIYYCQSGGTVNPLRQTGWFKFPYYKFSVPEYWYFINILFLLAYCVFISQLRRYTRVCSSYECLIPRAKWSSNNLLYNLFITRVQLHGRFVTYGLLSNTFSVRMILNNVYCCLWERVNRSASTTCFPM